MDAQIHVSVDSSQTVLEHVPQILHFYSIKPAAGRGKTPRHVALYKKRKHEWIDYCCSLRSMRHLK